MAAFLGHPLVLPVTIRSVTRTFASETANLRRVVVEFGAQRWEVDFQLRPDPRGAHRVAADIHAHRSRVRWDVFDFPLPPHVGDSGRTALTLTASANAGAATLSARSAATRTLQAGAWLTVAGQPKVYQLTADASVGPTGGTLDVYPALTAAASSGAALAAGGEATMRARWSPDSAEEYVYGAGGVASLRLTVEEAL